MKTISLRIALSLALATTAAINLAACASDVEVPSTTGTPPADSGAPQHDASTPPADNGPRCGSGAVWCGAGCTDTQTDTANCGDCGLRCATGQVCRVGSCVTPTPTPPPTTCATGQTACGATCCNLQTDTGNCGGCGMRCATGATCAAGRCVTPTPMPVCDTSRDTYDIVASPRLQAYCPEGVQVIVQGGARGEDVIITSNGNVNTTNPNNRYFGGSRQALSLSTRAGLWANRMIGVSAFCASTGDWLEASVIHAYSGYTNAADAGFQIIVRGRDIARTNCPITTDSMGMTGYPWCTIPAWMSCH